MFTPYFSVMNVNKNDNNIFNDCSYVVVILRVCRQYLECLSFSMEWLDDNFGMCRIYKGVINATQLVANDGTALYSKSLVESVNTIEIGALPCDDYLLLLISYKTG